MKNLFFLSLVVFAVAGCSSEPPKVEEASKSGDAAKLKQDDTQTKNNMEGPATPSSE